MINIDNLDAHVVGSSEPNKTFWRLYEFPNGYLVAITLDPHAPFRFEASIAKDGRHDLKTGLSTDEVENLLVEVANRPADTTATD